MIVIQITGCGCKSNISTMKYNIRRTVMKIVHSESTQLNAIYCTHTIGSRGLCYLGTVRKWFVGFFFPATD